MAFTLPPEVLKDMEDAMHLNDRRLGANLRPGDLHLEALGLGFDETAAARRTLEHYDPDLSCGCPADCAQHPWWTGA